jgi:HEPN domain-containing protein
MTANGLISQALGLQASYFVLKGKSKEVLSIDMDRKLLVFTGLTQSSSIILSFAIEIALKGLLKFRFNNFPKIHDLKKLYERLDENDRVQIFEIYKQKTDSDIEECLERHKDMFMEFRYLELEIDEPNDNEKIDAALNSIIEFYNLIKNNT